MTTAIVTGASGGIGSGVARALHEGGWRVLGLDWARPTSDVPWEHVDLDLSSPSDVIEWADEIAAPVRAIVHAAAVQCVIPAGRIAITDWEASWRTNVLSLQVLVGALLASIHGNELERVLSVGSVHSAATSAGMAPYSVTKAAQAAYVRALAIDNSSTGLAAIDIQLGAADTPKLWQGAARWSEPEMAVERIRSRIPNRELVRASDVGQLALQLMSPWARHLTGASLRYEGGTLSALPTEVE